MDLVKRYVYSVGRRLPEKQRIDIEKELESLILDTLQGRNPEGEKPSEKDIIEVLKEFGPPNEVAARYTQRPRYLISPRLYNAYFMLMGIVLGALALGLTVSGVIGFIGRTEGAGNIFTAMIGIIPGFISASLSAIGSVTIVFAIMERVIPEDESIEFNDGDWNPSDLPEIPIKNERVKLGECIAGVFFILVFFAVINLFPDKIGLYFYEKGIGWQVMPLFSQQALASYIPYWNVLMFCSLILHFVLLYRRRFSLTAHIFEIVLSFGALIVLSVMVADPNLVSLILPVGKIDVAAFEGYKVAAEILRRLIRVVLVILILITSGVNIKKIYYLFRQRTAE